MKKIFPFFLFAMLLSFTSCDFLPKSCSKEKPQLKSLDTPPFGYVSVGLVWVSCPSLDIKYSAPLVKHKDSGVLKVRSGVEWYFVNYDKYTGEYYFFDEYNYEHKFTY